MSMLASSRRSFEADGAWQVQVPLSAHSLAGFRAWNRTLPEKVKTALIHGHVYLDMSNEDIERHVAVKGAIFAAIHRIAMEEDLGQIYQDGGLLTNDRAQLACNPDAVGALWASFESGRFQVLEEAGRHPELQGTPDWVLEVVSPSSVTKDTRDLRRGYHAAGIAEYWLVDARRDLSFSILHWRKAGYVAATIDDAGRQWSKVFARHFRLRFERRRGTRVCLLDVKGK